MAELQEAKAHAGLTWVTRLTARMQENKLSMVRFKNYLKKQNGKPKSFANGVNLWVDYIDAAKYLGYDLKNDVFLLPKDLNAAHDKATKTAAVLKQARRSDSLKSKEEKRLRQLTKKYTYTDGNLLIRPPLNAAEIVEEGKRLKHCVGGYADRHVNGTTTILFLRDRSRPGRPLVTLEIKGGTLVQAHGWDDERSPCKDNPKKISPRELYKEFLAGWIAWVQAGSKRDKTGRPLLPKQQGAA